MNALDALYIPAAILAAPWWARKARSDWSGRFGRIATLPPAAPGTKRILLHAVSVGEVNALRELVPRLRGSGVEVVVSVGTDTGIARAKANFGALPGVFVVRYALDLSGAVRRFLDAVKPDGVALVELEVWPNFVRECRERSIPVCVINGRLSARSFRGYRRARVFLRRTFSSLSLVCAQDQAYAARFEAMGVDPARLRVTGSMKWDAAGIGESERPSAEALKLRDELGIDPARPLIVAGSTAPAGGTSEEALLHAACPEGVQLLCAPRKPEHAQAAFDALGGAGRCARRSSKTRAPAGTDRFLLDTIGELRHAYAIADLVVIGRTFGELGGSDPIESAALAKATLSGPNYSNFESAMASLLDAGAIRVVNAHTLRAEIRSLLKDASVRRDMGQRAVACVRANQGATGRHARAILSMVGLDSPLSDEPVAAFSLGGARAPV